MEVFLLKNLLMFNKKIVYNKGYKVLFLKLYVTS